MTHLLHGVLRRRLGETVTQKGSMVGPERMRFDISYPHAIPADELAAIEAEVNDQIRDNSAVETHLMEPEAAAAAGAMALFGEKYGDEVRVLMMGARDDRGRPFSTELCGGTHVRRTGDIGLFKIVSESAVGAGVRRIEAVTGSGAEAYVAREESALREVAQMLRAGPEELPRRVGALLDERRKLERELADARRALATGGGSRRNDGCRDIGGVRYSPQLLDGVPARELKSLADDLKKQLGSGIVALVSTADGKASLVVGVTEDLKERISAVDLVRAGSAAVGGKGGGGRPDMAQAGGPDAAQAQAALDAIAQAIATAA